jgi:hypothetical protein
MSDQWESNFTVVEMQEGGPGNPIKLMPSSTTVTGPTGGGQSVTSRWTRDYKRGAGAYKSAGVVVDSDPERYTADLSVRISITKFINDMNRRKCMHNLRVRQHCADVEDFTNYNAIMVMHEAYGTGQTVTENVANGTTAASVDEMNQVAESASDLVNVKQVSHLDVSDAVSDVAINEVIAVGYPICEGPCGNTNDGNQDYWAVTDVDTTPGYGVGAPVFLYTQDGEETWNASYINSALLGNATDVIKVGGKVLVALDANAVAYASFADILAGVVNPWVAAAGLTTPFPVALAQAEGGHVFACGDDGRIWESTNSGLSWTLISNGAQTTENLVDCAFASDVQGWFVGENGAIVEYHNGALTLIVARTAAGVALTDNILTVAVPEDREKEVYLGTAAGTIWRSRDTGGVFEIMPFPQSGVGQVNKLAFSGPRGFHLWIVQRNAAGTKSRVLRDLSGGALADFVEVIGSWDDPANSVINSVAPSDVNTAATVGELDGGYGFIGRIS